MSYILDALKRSDEDRRKGDVPDIHSQPGELVAASRRTSRPFRENVLPWVLLLISAGLLAWVLSRSMIVDTNSPPAPVTATEPDRNSSVDVSPVDEPIASREEDLSGSDAFLDELKDVRLDIPPADAVEAPEPRSSVADQSAAQTTDPGVVETVESEDERAHESGPPREAPQSESAVSESATSIESSVDSDPYQGIPHQRQLPYDVQDTLPDMNISVHMYSANPSSRLVRINNTIYHEGDLIDSELKLEQITPDGLIMTIRDERFWRHAR